MRLRTLIIVLFLLGASPLAAADRSLSYDEVVGSALRSSPEFAKIDASVAERLAEAAETQVKQNPFLDTAVRVPVDRGGGRSEVEVLLSQPLRPSDFGLRAQLAALIRDTASLERKVALLEFTLNLCLVYAKAWALQERRGILESSHRMAEGILVKVREGSSKGSLGKSDVAVFLGEVGLLGSEIIGAEADRKRAFAELGRISGAAVAGARLLVPPELILPSRDEVSVKVSSSALPAQQRSELLARMAAKQVELARLDSYPRFAPGLGYERTSEGADQLTLGFSVDLPFFDKNEAARVRALGTKQLAARFRDYATSGRLEEEVWLLYDAAVALGEQRRRLERKVIPAREQALRGYREQFEAGQGTTFQVAQSQRELTDARLRALDLWSQERSALTEMGILLGYDL